MPERLKDKTILITAAGNGIGRASAVAMAREGAQVFATDKDEAALVSLQEEVAAVSAFKLDVLNPEDIRAAAGKLPVLDVLFNCSGYVHHGTALECPDDVWDFSFNLNVKAHHRMITAFLPAMIANGGGSIINMASVVSSLKGVPNRYVYGATKAAVIGLTKSIAADFIEQGIRCNAVCPGTVDTPSLRARMRDLGESMGGYEKARDVFLARQPTGKLASADEIAPLIVFLASDESRFVTGREHVIDGGWAL